jgi:hypothetical protein
MESNTFLVLAWVSTGFIAVSTLAYGYAAYQWFRAVRNSKHGEKRLVAALLVDNGLLFIIVGVRLALTLAAWLSGEIALGQATSAAVWRGVITWFMVMVAALTAGGIASGKFSMRRKVNRDISP